MGLLVWGTCASLMCVRSAQASITNYVRCMCFNLMMYISQKRIYRARSSTPSKEEVTWTWTVYAERTLQEYSLHAYLISRHIDNFIWNIPLSCLLLSFVFFCFFFFFFFPRRRQTRSTHQTFSTSLFQQLNLRFLIYGSRKAEFNFHIDFR